MSWPCSEIQPVSVWYAGPICSYGPRWTVVALIGAMFGLVIVNSLRGHGFVRGTGEPGSMQPADVDEDRGFYWRS